MNNDKTLATSATTSTGPSAGPAIHAFRGLARHWVERRLHGDLPGARRALAGFVARLGRSFTATERDAFFGAVEHCIAEHRARAEQRAARLDLLTKELAAANDGFEERPTIIVARRAERFSLPSAS